MHTIASPSNGRPFGRYRWCPLVNSATALAAIQSKLFLLVMISLIG